MISKEVNQARLDCLIYFATKRHGWYANPAHRDETGKMRFDGRGSSLIHDQRLGFPTPWRIIMASKRVRACCPEACLAYRLARRDLREAHRRWLATRSAALWKEYLATVKRNEVSYKIFKAPKRHGRLFRYWTGELKPTRRQEGVRARREFLAASAKMGEIERLIFERMGVPELFRGELLDEQRLRDEFESRITGAARD